MGFTFIGRVMVARIYGGTESTEYGIFSLAFVILNFCAALATLGFEFGIPRTIAYSRGRGDIDRAHRVIPVAILAGTVSSLIVALSLFSLSGTIATQIFGESQLALPLKILAAGLAFFVITKVICAIFQGFDNIVARAYFHDILRSVLFPILLIPWLFTEPSTIGVYYAYLASLVLPCIGLILYVKKRDSHELTRHLLPTKRIDQGAAKELLTFSLPLLLSATLQMIIGWSDSLVIGMIRSADEVGLYNAAYPAALFIFLPAAAVGGIYVPIASKLYGERNMPQLQENCRLMSKWIFWLSAPIILVILLWPKTVLSIFGPIYAENSATALRILSIGFILSNLTGIASGTLIAIGLPRFILMTNLVAAVINITLNFLLIPKMGINGAAIVSTVSFTVISILRAWKIRAVTGSLPFGPKLARSGIATGAAAFLAFVAFGSNYDLSLWSVPLVTLSLYGLTFVAAIITRSIEPADTALVRATTLRIGLYSRRLDRILSKLT